MAMESTDSELWATSAKDQKLWIIPEVDNPLWKGFEGAHAMLLAKVKEDEENMGVVVADDAGQAAYTVELKARLQASVERREDQWP